MAENWINYTPGQGWGELPVGAFGVGSILSMPMIQQYALANGFKADDAQLPNLSGADAPDPFLDPLGFDAYVNRQTLLADPIFDRWLTDQGLSARFSRTGAGGKKFDDVAQLVNAAGDVVANDAHTYGKTDRAATAAAVLATLGGVGLSMGLGGAGAGAGGAAGGGGAGAAGSTLGAGASGAAGAGSAGLTASLPSSAELLGGLTSSSSLFNPIALAPSLGAGAGLTAGIGAADMGGLSSAGLEASGWAAPISGAQSSAGLGSFGTLGAGAGAPSVTTPGISAADTAGIGLSNTAPLTGVPSTVGGGGLLGSIANSGVGQAVGQVADARGRWAQPRRNRRRLARARPRAAQSKPPQPKAARTPALTRTCTVTTGFCLSSSSSSTPPSRAPMPISRRARTCCATSTPRPRTPRATRTCAAQARGCWAEALQGTHSPWQVPRSSGVIHLPCSNRRKTHSWACSPRHKPCRNADC
jgi:hypothetical protein